VRLSADGGETPPLQGLRLSTTRRDAAAPAAQLLYFEHCSKFILNTVHKHAML
jgi:hypothetical protein